jgi:hypothetical protein
MEMRSTWILTQAELAEELLLVENSLLFTEAKLRYFPSDDRQHLAALTERRAKIVEMIVRETAFPTR